MDPILKKWSCLLGLSKDDALALLRKVLAEVSEK